MSSNGRHLETAAKRTRTKRKLHLEPLETRVLLAIDAATADLNDDRAVNTSDLRFLSQHLGLRAGDAGFLDGLDLRPDGVINQADVRELTARSGAKNVSISNTVVRGIVTDTLGNPLPNATVKVGSVIGQTNAQGAYELPVGRTEFGKNRISIIGKHIAGGTVVEAEDPTPGFLSGQYPTIPNKPIFVNGGTVNNFRIIALPERDLNGAVAIDDTNSTGSGDARVLTEDILVENAGVRLFLPAGSEITFPPHEDHVLSLTRIDPAMLPVSMPRGLNSSLFITYQPGGTDIVPPSGGELVTEFDNVDGFLDTDVPLFNGVTADFGVFAPIADCTVSGLNISCPLGADEPFHFAWYHTDIIRDPDPRTTVQGQVFRNRDALGNPINPVNAATVTVAGVGVVLSNAAGNFSIPNVPSRPNGLPGGPFFNIRATAYRDFDVPADGLQADEIGISATVPANPGGITNVGPIVLADLGGTVHGRVTALTSLSPFAFEGVATDLSLTQGGATIFESTAEDGNFAFFDVAVGSYELFADPFPYVSHFSTNPVFDAIDFVGDTDAVNFAFVGAGQVDLTVIAEDTGLPVSGATVFLSHDEQVLGAGYVSPSTFVGGETDSDGLLSFGGIPLGAFQLDVFGLPIVEIRDENGDLVDPAALQVNAHNELVSLTVVVPSAPEGEGDVSQLRFSFSDFTEVQIQRFDVFYTQPIVSPTISEARLIFEFDTDSDAATGFGSVIDGFSPPSGSTGLGVDVRLTCTTADVDLDCLVESTSDEYGGVELFNALNFDFTNDFPDYTHVIIEIDTFFLNLSEANVAFASELIPALGEQLLVIGGGNVVDVVPGNLDAESGGSRFVDFSEETVIDDSLGDTFIPPPLAATASIAPAPATTEVLRQATLDRAVEAAIGRWAAAGVTAEQIALLRSTSYDVAVLPGRTLGQVTPQGVLIDWNAAGYGWFVDPTPLDDSEFSGNRNSPAASRVDLLTVTMHEMGHVLGLEHTSDDHSLLSASLSTFERRLPDGLDDDHHHETVPRWLAAFAPASSTLSSRRSAHEEFFSQLLPGPTRSSRVESIIARVSQRLQPIADRSFWVASSKADEDESQEQRSVWDLLFGDDEASQ